MSEHFTYAGNFVFLSHNSTKNIKEELRTIIVGDGSVSETSQLKKTQNFLRRYAQTSFRAKKQKYLKSEEEISLINFAITENLIYSNEISEEQFISAGAEQRVYRYDDLMLLN